MSIDSLFQSLLRRNPDEGAYATFAGYSDDDIANSIYGSQEYADLQNQSNPQQQQQNQASSGLDDNAINQLYQQYLGRGADQGGLDNWRGKSYDEVVSGIVNSGEYAQRIMGQQTAAPAPAPAPTPAPAPEPASVAPSGVDDTTTNQLYQQYLGRNADQGGLDNWRGKSRDEVIQGILGSSEYAERNKKAAEPAPAPAPAASSGLDDNAINQLYQQYLGRNADSGGLDTWRGKSLDEVVKGITNSSEYAERLAGQKTAAATTPAPTGSFSAGGVNWTLDPTNLAKNAVSWSDYYGMGQYHYADGSTALADPSSPNTAVSVTPPFSAYEDPANKRLGYRNYAYSGTNLPDTLTINGVEVQVVSPELLLNPQGKVFTDPNAGNRTYTIQDVSPQPKDSQSFQIFDSIIKIGAAIMGGVAFAPVGAAILESATGMTAAELTASYGATAVNSVTSALSGATSSAVNTALQGGDVNKIIETAAKAAVTAGAGSAVAGSLPGDLSSTAAGATTGAAKGAVTAALSGQDILTGAAKGVIPGVVGGAVLDASKLDFSGTPDFTGDEQVVDTTTGEILSPTDVAKLNPDLYPGGVLPKEGQVTEYNPDGSAKYVDVPTAGEKIASSTGSTLAGGFLVPYLFPTSKSSSGGTTTSGSSPSAIKTGPGQGSSPGTAPSLSAKNISNTPSLSTAGLPITGSSYFGPNTSALGQALRTGSGALGGTSADAGAGGEDTSKETGGTPQNVWNTASLRYKDETGS